MTPDVDRRVDVRSFDAVAERDAARNREVAARRPEAAAD